MSKQSAIILILVVFLGALGALIYFYFTFNATPATQNLGQASGSDTYDPFGTKASDNIFSNATNTAPTASSSASLPTIPDRLREISTEPVSGFSIIDDKKNQQTNIHYILRSNGNIYEAYADSPEQKRLSNTTVPKVYESRWFPDGVRLVIRYLKDDNQNIQTFSVKINPATTTLNEFEGGIDGNHLTDNIGSLVVNPAGDKLFYLTDNLNGASGFITKPTGLNAKLIFESPLVEWLVSWPKESTITLTTKPSANIAGYLYFLNSQTGNFSRILGNINGLTTKTNSTATEVLYSDSSRGTPQLYLFNIKKGESKILPWNTLPEKCVWSNTDDKIIYCAVPKNFPTLDYPDAWYQGIVNFTDDIWMMNTDTGAATLVFDISRETNNNIDATDLTLDNNDNYLFFTNKTNLTLWSLNLK